MACPRGQTPFVIGCRSGCRVGQISDAAVAADCFGAQPHRLHLGLSSGLVADDVPASGNRGFDPTVKRSPFRASFDHIRQTHQNRILGASECHRKGGGSAKWQRYLGPLPRAHKSRRFSCHWSNFSFSADLTVRFQIGFPALAAPLAVLRSSLVATKRWSRMISNTNLFSARLTTSRAMTSSSILTLLTVTRSSLCSLAVL
jgi:hypothetical protein